MHTLVHERQYNMTGLWGWQLVQKKSLFKISLLLLGIALMGQGKMYCQCTDNNIDKISQDIGRKIVEKCTSSPNKLTISTTECIHEIDKKTGLIAWEIKTTTSWIGKYTTMHYTIKLYMEVTLQKNSKVKSILVYLVDYSDSLIHRCIDLSKTKPLELNPGSVAYYPVIEMDPSELE